MIYWALLFDLIPLHWNWVIVGNGGTPFEKVSAIYCYYYYYDSIYLTNFTLITSYWVSMVEFIFNTKIRNNTEKAPFGIPVARTEHENDLRVKTIIESKIYFLLEIYR